uniref:Uncharacterized protein n=1 Tax=Ciona savignyi TaxID=51511 RepID=H2YXP7_CIOSA
MPRSGGNPQSVADTISHTEIMSESSKPDDGRSTGAESAIFTDAESVVSTETPLKSALKKSSRAPPVPRSYLEDDESTVISSSTIQPNELKQFKQRRFSLDGTLDDSHGRGNPNKRSVSMRKPVPTSRDLGPKMAAGRPTHIRRSNSLDRTPGPRGPIFNPNQPRMRMPRPMGPRGQFTPPGVIPHPGPMYGAFPPPRMAPRYPPHMQHRFATMHPGQPRYGRYWNDGMAPDSDWDSHSLRSEVDMMQQPPIMTMRGMRPRFRMDGMRVQRPPNMGISRFNRPAPPPYYSLQR